MKSALAEPNALAQLGCTRAAGSSLCKTKIFLLSYFCHFTTHQVFHETNIVSFYLKGLKFYQPSKLKILDFSLLTWQNFSIVLYNFAFQKMDLNPMRIKIQLQKFLKKIFA